MVGIVRRKRKSPVLTPSTIPCLRQLPTINITQGCAIGCVYCYIQGYPDYPGSGRIVLYENTADMVREELARRRKRPRRVYFSPSSDAFQNVPEVQDVSFDTMHVLLDAGVEVSFLTKGIVGSRFVDLFACSPQSVFAQVGITTLDDNLSAEIEPNAASASQRLSGIAALTRAGVSVTARLDPLIPDLTDTRESIVPLLSALRRAGVRAAAASYLFIRPRLTLRGCGLEKITSRCGSVDTWPHQRFLDGCGGGRMISVAERRHRFELLQTLGHEAGVAIRACRCKNPDLTSVGCDIAGPSRQTNPTSAEQPSLPFTDPACNWMGR